jgi:hypothetical protein
MRTLARFLAASACIALAVAPVQVQSQRPKPPSIDTLPRPAAVPSDVSSISAIIGAVYDVISGPAGKARDWNRFRSLFVPNARLIPSRVRPDGGADAVVWSADDYATAAGPRLEQGGFFEREISRSEEAFGNVVHVFSTYESRRSPNDEKPFARGINSIQLLKDGGRYWVVTIFWDSERPDNPIPAKYLKPGP